MWDGGKESDGFGHERIFPQCSMRARKMGRLAWDRMDSAAMQDECPEIVKVSVGSKGSCRNAG